MGPGSVSCSSLQPIQLTLTCFCPALIDCVYSRYGHGVLVPVLQYWLSELSRQILAAIQAHSL